MRPTIEGLLSLLFPRVCGVCGRVLVEGEQTMCVSCRVFFPLTRFEERPDWNGLTEKLMTLKAPVERTAAYFFYQRRSPYSRLIQQMKYNHAPSLGRGLMREYAARLRDCGFFDGIDALVPVPLSLGKHIMRGYNQSYYLARGVADVTGLPIIEALRAGRHGSQTRLSASERLANARGIYSACPEALAGVSHLLLIDDIVTTGATACACLEALHQAAPGVRLSVLALASTRLQ
ncbi:MAG: ComF family protein [Muribaculaceae bacterium]|nr:ComF family protein [Bacteroides sp.]MDE6262694.1 ComF family protein [Muribaculaceae bacterium]